MKTGLRENQMKNHLKNSAAVLGEKQGVVEKCKKKLDQVNCAKLIYSPPKIITSEKYSPLKNIQGRPISIVAIHIRYRIHRAL